MFPDIKEKIFGAPPNVEFIHGNTTNGKAEWVIWFEKVSALLNSLGVCLVAGNGTFAMGPTHFSKLYSACTGWEISPPEIMKTADRIFNLMKAYIVREGLTRKDDDWPARFYDEALPDGPFAGVVLSREKLTGLLDEYYELRGWDKTRGVPTKKKLVELDLDYVAEELSGLGLI